MTSAPTDAVAVKDAIIQWLLGDWASLAQVNVPPGSTSRESLLIRTLVAAAELQAGDAARGGDLAERVVRQLGDNEFTGQIMLSGAYNSLARAGALLGNRDFALENFAKAITESPFPGNSDMFLGARRKEQLAQIGRPSMWAGAAQERQLRLDGFSSSIFIDCGGYDGCSAIKFLLRNPSFEVVSFESNPELWDYYIGLPTRLIKKAVFTHNGTAPFVIDPLDADGSSLIPEKRIDFHGKVKNEDCPVIEVLCEDLSAFVKDASETHSRVVLKLDVEGAEYAILEKMLAEKTLGLVETLYCEFHWKKMGLERHMHDQILEEVQAVLGEDGVKPWDAQEFSCHSRDASSYRRRKVLAEASRMLHEYFKYA